MSYLTSSVSKATVVVGVDFGTTFSGFAFARMSEPDDVKKFYEWPSLGAAGGGHYCKTQTSLLYERGQSPGCYVLKDWGYSAWVNHVRGKKSNRPEQISYGEDLLGTNQGPVVPGNEAAWRQQATHFVTLFKLQLVSGECGRTSAAELPDDLTTTRLISDYLRELSALIMRELRKAMGSHITMEDVQWCLTVPAIWDDQAKQDMKICAAMAGMTKGSECPRDLMDSASPHPIMIVIEPEAASLYCQRKVQFPFNDGDQFLIVDVGGGTVDLVLHEKVGSGSGLSVREVSPSSGGLFGGSFVDSAFFDFLSRKIRCFRNFARSHPDSVLKLRGWWETIKYGFDGSNQFLYDLELPARLASAWEDDENSNCERFSGGSGSYDAIELSLEDMLGLFDPVVNEILKLIEAKLLEASDLKVMMIVGGFSGSPYLVKRIREEFSSRVGSIVVPDEPGSAICCGAVAYGLYGADVIMSRISKKTYGIKSSRHFYLTDPPHLMFQDDDGKSRCSHVFSVYTKKNDEIPLDHCVSRKFYPINRSQTKFSISLFSTSDLNPKYVSDPGVTKEGTFHMTFPSQNELGEWPAVSVSMHFGRTLIEVEAEGVNFGNGEKIKMPPVRFERTFD